MAGIEIQLPPTRAALYREALGRLRVDGGFRALVTDDAEAAGCAEVPVLLVDPQKLSPDRLAALQTARREIMPAHECRFLPEVAPIKEAVAAGKLGAPGSLRAHAWTNDDISPDQLAFAYLDIAQWLFGAKARVVHSVRSTDYLQLHLAFPEGGMALIDVATSRPGPDPYFSMHLVGSAGTVYADDHRNTHLLFRDRGTAALIHRPSRILAIRGLLEEFISDDWSVTLAHSWAAKHTLEIPGYGHV